MPFAYAGELLKRTPGAALLCIVPAMAVVVLFKRDSAHETKPMPRRKADPRSDVRRAGAARRQARAAFGALHSCKTLLYLDLCRDSHNFLRRESHADRQFSRNV